MGYAYNKSEILSGLMYDYSRLLLDIELIADQSSEEFKNKSIKLEELNKKIDKLTLEG